MVDVTNNNGITPQNGVMLKLTDNPIIRLAGHILVGAAVSVGSFLGGAFIQGVAIAIQYAPLSTIGGTNVGLGVITAGMTFAGYVGYQILQS